MLLFLNNKGYWLRVVRVDSLPIGSAYHIKTIEFSASQIAWLQYKKGNDTDTVRELKNIDITAPELLPILKLDCLSNDILAMKSELDKIHVNRFRVIDYFDRYAGETSKEIGLHFDKTMNGLTFYY